MDAACIHYYTVHMEGEKSVMRKLNTYHNRLDRIATKTTEIMKYTQRVREGGNKTIFSKKENNA